MVTDVILSGLTNLFALFGAMKDVDTNYSTTTLSNYFSRHFGIRNVEVFTDLYNELRELYSMSPDLDKDAIIEGICQNFAGKMKSEEQELILLRLMEFCDTEENAFNREEFIFRSVQKKFGVDDEVYAEFCNFIEGKTSDYVSIQHYENLDGYLRVLWLKKRNKLLFSYHGNDTVLMDDIPVLHGVYQTWAQSGVLKVNKSGLRIYFSSVFSVYMKEEEREEIEFCGRNIDFRFPNSNNGLHNFSFDIENGQLLAIMGGSGAGKTTLQSILNGTLQPQSGKITINGHDINEPEVKQLIGYVPQDDLLIAELTVFENLLFTARLTFEGLPKETIEKRVLEVLRQLDLLQAKDLKVGSPESKTISGGQRKRLNIALELIREPAVLFLDEPTSGMSSADTEKMINILKELTCKGKLVIVNIHQPSSDVYKLFDRLWLLDKGGYPVFDGSPIEAITYFKTAANYADAEFSTCTMCGNVNPEVVLNIIDEKAFDEKGQITDRRKVSPEEWNRMYMEQLGTFSEPKVLDVPKTDQRKPGVFKQFWIFLERTFSSKKSNLQYIIITLLEAPVLAMICAGLTHYAPQEGYSLMDNKNFISYMFMAVIVATFMGMSGSAEDIIRDRLILKREKFLCLSYASYISSKIVFMAIVALVQTLLFVVIGNAITGIDSLWTTWWGVLFLTSFVAGLTGLLLSQIMNTVVSIYITIPLLLVPQILLCGIVVDFSDLSPKSTTGNVPLIGNLVPSRWAYEALSVSQFKDNEFEKPLFDIQKKKYESQYFRYAHIEEIQSQIETIKSLKEKGKEVPAKHLDIVKKAMPALVEFTRMPYTGAYDYASLKEFTEKADALLSTKSNEATLEEDKVISERLKTIGKEEYKEMKRENYNLSLEDVVVNANSKVSHTIVDGHIVPKMGYIFVSPQTRCGGAPFYSSEKKLGSITLSTLTFNSLVLIFFSLIISIMLYTDFPGKYIRRNSLGGKN